MFDTTLTAKQNAGSLIEAYQRNTQRISAGYDLLVEADVDVAHIFGGRTIIPRNSSPNSSKEKALADLRITAWRAIVNNLGLEKIMSLKRSRTFQENCDQGKLPEIDTESVHRFLEDVIGNAYEIASESVREIYDWLRPGASRHDPYKINAKNARWKLGKKIILQGILEVRYGGQFMVNYYRRDHLRQLDRIMHLLDGAGVPEGYVSPLIDAINITCLEIGAGETTYFSFRCYLNGNLHLTFKRVDLVDRLNARAGGRNVLGDG